MFSVGVEQTVPVGKKTYTFSRMTTSVFRRMAEWLQQIVGDPFALVERMKGVLPEEERMALFREAKDVQEQVQFFSLDAPLFKRLMATERGVLALFEALLLKHHPHITEDEVFDVAQAAGLKLGEIVRKAQGGPEGNVPGAEGGSAAGTASIGSPSSTA